MVICSKNSEITEHNQIVKLDFISTDIKKSHVIYENLNSRSPIYKLESGCVKIGSFDEKGSSVVYDIALPGDYFSKLSDHYNKNEFAIAIIDSKLSIIGQSDFVNQIQYHKSVFSNVSGRMLRFQDRLTNLSSTNSESKIKYILKHFDIKVTDLSGFTFDLLKLLTVKEIAALCGVTRQSVSKFIKSNFSPFYNRSF